MKHLLLLNLGSVSSLAAVVGHGNVKSFLSSSIAGADVRGRSNSAAAAGHVPLVV